MSILFDNPKYLLTSICLFGLLTQHFSIKCNIGDHTQNVFLNGVKSVV